MQFAEKAQNRAAAGILAAGTGIIFGLDLSDPQTVNTLLGGGLAFIALVVLYRLVTRALVGRDAGECNESKLIDTVNVLLIDINKALLQQTEVVTNNTEAMKSLHLLWEKQHADIQTRLSVVESKVDLLLKPPCDPPEEKPSVEIHTG